MGQGLIEQSPEGENKRLKQELERKVKLSNTRIQQKRDKQVNLIGKA